MILQPGILALSLSSLIITMMTLYAAGYGVVIVRRWDISCGSELQLTLERRTYLISTIMSYVLLFQLVSLSLFVHTADSICHLFTGAMCAVGTLTANPFGYPTLVLKTVTFLLAGVWLILNLADNRGYDYPLIRAKYLLLIVLGPLVLAETAFQAIYFLRLDPDIITSCCGSLFSSTSRGIASEIAAFPPVPMGLLYCATAAVTLAAGGCYLLSGKGAVPFAMLSAINLPVTLAAIVAFISLYIYEMPSHHCPFCILQKEYGYIGYLLYGLLLFATVTGIGVGVLHPFRSRESMKLILPSLQRKLAAFSLLSLAGLTVAVTWRIITTNFTLGVL